MKLICRTLNIIDKINCYKYKTRKITHVDKLLVSYFYA